jgi:histidinol-phosphate phosphatase family protein
MTLKPAIFMDKDGTLVRDVPYNVDPARMVFEPGVEGGLARLAALARPVFVISNQPGVGLGLFEQAALEGVHAELSRMLARAGVRLAGFYYCPHSIAAGGIAGFACECRKPAPGMLMHAAAAHGLDLHASWMIGDILDDVEAGNRAGCRTVLIDNGNETEWRPGPWRVPSLISPDFDAGIQAMIEAESASFKELP